MQVSSRIFARVDKLIGAAELLDGWIPDAAGAITGLRVQQSPRRRIAGRKDVEIVRIRKPHKRGQKKGLRGY